MYKKANILYLAVFALMLVAGAGILALAPKIGLAFSEWLLIFLPTVVFIVLYKLDWREFIPLRQVSWPVWLVTLGLSIALWAVATVFSAVIAVIVAKMGLQPMPLPIPVPKTAVDWVVIFFGVSISAGIVEEVMFRGFIFRAYREWGAQKAIFFSTLLFAVLHGSFYRFLPVFFLGLFLGYMVQRTGSILPTIFAHMLNNALSLVFLTLVTGDDRFPFTGDAPMEKPFLALFVVSLFALPVLLKLLKKITPIEAVVEQPLSWGAGLKKFITHWPVAVSLALFALLGLIEMTYMIVKGLVS